MRNLSTSLTLGAEKSAAAQLCAMSWYLGSKETVIKHAIASVFTARNPRNPEGPK